MSNHCSALFPVSWLASLLGWHTALTIAIWSCRKTLAFLCETPHVTQSKLAHTIWSVLKDSKEVQWIPMVPIFGCNTEHTSSHHFVLSDCLSISIEFTKNGLRQCMALQSRSTVQSNCLLLVLLDSQTIKIAIS
jgi:hypothetical protein